MIKFTEKTTITAGCLPDCKFGNNGMPRQAQLLTNANYNMVASNLGLAVRYNLMSSTVEIVHNGALISDAGESARAVNAIEDSLLRADAGGGLHRLRGVMHAEAAQNQYHPMAEYLKGLPKADGVDHIGKAVASVSTSSKLWPSYFENWLIQVVAGVTNTTKSNFSLPYCLVFAGAQGIGKTRFFEGLAPAFVKTEAELHLNTAHGKDHALEALSHPIVELSELDGVFRKADTAVLKAFLSRGCDSIRAPYAAAPVIRTRRTVFCASVNSTAFLNDQTGARRFWPVQVDAIDWTHGVDVDQLWAQALALHAVNPSFELSEDELKDKAESQAAFYSPPLEEDVLATYFARHCGNYDSYYGLSISDIASAIGAKNVNRAGLNTLRTWLSHNLYPAKMVLGTRTAWAFPLSALGAERCDGAPRLTNAQAKKAVLKYKIKTPAANYEDPLRKIVSLI